MIFSSNVDRRKTNPLIYVKFWRQTCLPSLLFGAELFTIVPSLLLELERCQSCFLKKLFMCQIPPPPPPPRVLLLIGSLNYDLFYYFEIWFNSSTFPTYGNWKLVVKNKVRDLESRLWLQKLA